MASTQRRNATRTPARAAAHPRGRTSEAGDEHVDLPSPPAENGAAPPTETSPEEGAPDLIAVLELERDAAQQRASEAEQAAREIAEQAATATSAASTQGEALRALEAQAKEADAAARRAREERAAAEERAEETDARTARLAARAERRARELTASRDTAQQQLAEVQAALSHAERRIATLERQRDDALGDAERELARAARSVPTRHDVPPHPAPPRGLPPEWVVGAILVLLGATIVVLVATGTLAVDLIP